MEELKIIDIMFDDLSERKQAEILEVLGVGYEETNYDVFPVAQLILKEEE